MFQRKSKTRKPVRPADRPEGLNQWRTVRAEAQASACTLNFNPDGRVVQAVVCKTVEAGAIPARDSNHSSLIGKKMRDEVLNEMGAPAGGIQFV